MKYTIRIFYETGDSFGSEMTKDDIPITWKKLDVAKAALRRIGERDQAENDPNVNQTQTEGYVGEYSISLQLDDGTEQSISCFWMGVFERLEKAQIITIEDDMVYIPWSTEKYHPTTTAEI